MRNAATEAERQRRAKASGDISLSQIDIDAAKLERVIDDLTVELGCKYCQHDLIMSDADFSTLSVEQVLQNMRNMAPKIHLTETFVWGWGGCQSDSRVAGNAQVSAPYYQHSQRHHGHVF